MQNGENEEHNGKAILVIYGDSRRYDPTIHMAKLIQDSDTYRADNITIRNDAVSENVYHGS